MRLHGAVADFPPFLRHKSVQSTGSEERLYSQPIRQYG
jgi:hypothetical protein